jgi:hypothetical protein
MDQNSVELVIKANDQASAKIKEVEAETMRLVTGMGDLSKAVIANTASNDRMTTELLALGSEAKRLVTGMGDLSKATISVQASMGQTADKLRQSETETTRLANSTTALGMSFGTVAKMAGTVGIALGASQMIRAVSDVALMAARYETLGVVMTQVGKTAGYTASQMTQFEQGLESTGISMNSSREALAKLVQAHVDLTNATKLARVAQDAAVIGNINSSEAFDRLVYGIQSAQVEVLRTIGINVNFENSYKALGAQLGKNANDLTETEKSQARVNAVLEAGKAITGSYEAAMGTAGKQLKSMERYLQDLGVMAGAVFGPALTDGVKAVNSVLADLKKALEDNQASLTDVGHDMDTVTRAIIDTTASVNGLLSIFNGMPADLLTGGVLGGILIGTGGSSLVATLGSIYWAMSKMGAGVTSLIDTYREAVTYIREIQDVLTGQKNWNTGELTAYGHAVQDAADAAQEASGKAVSAYGAWAQAAAQLKSKEAAAAASAAANELGRAGYGSGYNHTYTAEQQKQFEAEENKRAAEELTDELKAQESAAKSAESARVRAAGAAARAQEQAAVAAKKAAEEYQQSLASITNEYAKLTMSAQEYAKLQIWREWDKEAAKATDLAIKVRDMKLAAVDTQAHLEELKKTTLQNIAEHPENYANTDMFVGLKEANKRAQELMNVEEKTSSYLIKLSQNTAQQMEQNFSSFYFDVMTGKITSLADFWTSILNTLAKVTSNMLGQITAQLVFGEKMDMSSGLFDWLFSSSSFSRHASGGGFPAGQPFWAGEEGAELIFPGSSGGGHVLSHQDSVRYASSMGISVPGYASGTTSLPAISQQPNVSVTVNNHGAQQVTAKPNVSINGQDIFVDLLLDTVNRNVGRVREALGMY